MDVGPSAQVSNTHVWDLKEVPDSCFQPAQAQAIEAIWGAKSSLPIPVFVIFVLQINISFWRHKHLTEEERLNGLKKWTQNCDTDYKNKNTDSKLDWVWITKGSKFDSLFNFFYYLLNCKLYQGLYRVFALIKINLTE